MNILFVVASQMKESEETAEIFRKRNMTYAEVHRYFLSKSFKFVLPLDFTLFLKKTELLEICPS